MTRRIQACTLALTTALAAAPALAQEPAPAAEEPKAAPKEPETAAPAPSSREPENVSPEVASLLREAETQASEPVPQSPLLRTYGFMDFGVNRFWTSKESQLNFLFPTKATTFVLGNINLFFDANPAPGWRSLVEVRFTNLPHGQEASFATPFGDRYQRVSTSTNDFTSPSIRNEVVLGSIIIERAWAEYAFSDLFKAQAGYFLTPYGVWNQDHGTPTLISLMLPAFEADQYIPNRQLGLQLHGSGYVPGWQLGYHAYVANGPGPSQVSLTEQKAFGGRAFASSMGSAVKATIGASGYYGVYTDTERAITSFDPYVLETRETAHVREWAVGGDLSVDAGALRLRNEAILYRTEAEPGKRRWNQPDMWLWNGYTLVAYQLPWLGLEPYAYFEVLHAPLSFGDTLLLPSAGVNVHFNPSVQLKTQYAHGRFYDFSVDEDRRPSDNNAHNAMARLVVSF